MSEISKCPFCHYVGDQQPFTSCESNPARAYVRCRVCGARGPIKATREEAVEAWNIVSSLKLTGREEQARLFAEQMQILRERIDYVMFVELKEFLSKHEGVCPALDKIVKIKDLSNSSPHLFIKNDGSQPIEFIDPFYIDNAEYMDNLLKEQ